MVEKVWIHIPKSYYHCLGNWNNFFSYELKDDGVDIVAYNFDTSTKDYIEFVSMLKQQEIKSNIFRREYSFTTREKEQAEILELIIDGDANDSDSIDSIYYDCEICGNKIRKVNRSNVLVDYKHIKKYDISISNPPNSEIFVSDKFREILHNENLSGARFSSIYQLNRQQQEIKDFYNLHLEVGIGEVIDPTIVEKGQLCKACGFYTKFLKKGLLFFSRKEWKGIDICFTKDTFGSIWANRYVGSRQIIISNRMYQVLKQNKLKSFSVRPTFFID